MTCTAGPGGPTAAMLALLLTLAGPLVAAGGNYSGGVDLEPIVALIDTGDCEVAIARLHVEPDYDPDNADILSLPGFSDRKTRRFDDALAFYQWALRVEPKHRGANEYLDELYLETDQLDMALRQLEILDDLCTFSCKEYSQLKRAIDLYQETASNS